VRDLPSKGGERGAARNVEQVYNRKDHDRLRRRDPQRPTWCGLFGVMADSVMELTVGGIPIEK